MSQISEQENTERNLQLLVAQGRLYTEAKHIRNWRIGVSLAFTVAAPIVAIFVPGAPGFLALTAFMWGLLTYFPLRQRQLSKTKQAATIQEQFDVGLLKLPWNHILVGDYVDHEDISRAARASKIGAAQYRDWYTDPGSIPFPLDVLLCQRASSGWDWRLRRRFAGYVLWCIVGIIVADLALSLILNQYTIDFLLTLLIPTAPALQQLGESYLAYRESAAEREELLTHLKNLWDVALRNPSAVTQTECRQIQDRIYALRKKDALVPDFVYRWLQPGHQADMDAAVRELRTQAETALQNH